MKYIIVTIVIIGIILLTLGLVLFFKKDKVKQGSLSSQPSSQPSSPQSDNLIQMKDKGASILGPPYKPLGECEGDCDEGECKPGLVCDNVSPGWNQVIPPGCKNSGKKKFLDTYSFCVKKKYSSPSSGKGAIQMVNKGADPPKPLSECEGDCDEGGCGLNLVCDNVSAGWQNKVPIGCSNSGGTTDIPLSYSFCIKKKYSSPSSGKGTIQMMNKGPDLKDPKKPLSECEGDCDEGECKPGLKCDNPKDGWNQVIPPGCINSKGTDFPPKYSFCVRK